MTAPNLNDLRSYYVTARVLLTGAATDDEWVTIDRIVAAPDRQAAEDKVEAALAADNRYQDGLILRAVPATEPTA